MFDFEAIAPQLGNVSADEIAQRIYKRQFTSFRVRDLQVIIRHLRATAQYFPHLVSRGNKQALISGLVRTIEDLQARQVHLTGKSDLVNQASHPSPPGPIPPHHAPPSIHFIQPPLNCSTHLRPYPCWTHSTPAIAAHLATCSPYAKSPQRSPFLPIRRVLGQALVHSLSCNTLHFVCDEVLLDLFQSQKENNQQIHLRLLSLNQQTHEFRYQEWDGTYRVLLNGQSVSVASSKYHGHQKRVQQASVQAASAVVVPLDISHLVQKHNQVHIQFNHQLHSSQIGSLHLVAELVDILTAAHLTHDVPAYDTMLANHQSLRLLAQTLVAPTCGLCIRTENLRRCSRCKQAWYCSPEHQSQHWAAHRSQCIAPTPHAEVRLQREQNRAAAAFRCAAVPPEDDESEIMIADAVIPLACPLSGGDIEQAARGWKCEHQRCFDLETFLVFCQMTGSWQCPICHRPLPFQELRIDAHMNKLIVDAGPKASRVRLHRDGTFVVLQNTPALERTNQRQGTSGASCQMSGEAGRTGASARHAICID